MVVLVLVGELGLAEEVPVVVAVLEVVLVVDVLVEVVVLVVLVVLDVLVEVDLFEAVCEDVSVKPRCCSPMCCSVELSPDVVLEEEDTCSSLVVVNKREGSVLHAVTGARYRTLCDTTTTRRNHIRSKKEVVQ